MHSNLYAQTVGSRIIPNNELTYNGSQVNTDPNIFIEAADAGAGSGLHAPTVRLKLLFPADDPNPNKQVDLFDIACNRNTNGGTTSFDNANNGSGVRWDADGHCIATDTVVKFFGTNAQETIVGQPFLQLGYNKAGNPAYPVDRDLKNPIFSNNWATIDINLNDLPAEAEPSNYHGMHVVVLEVTLEDAVDSGSGPFSVNAFKAQISSGTNGYISYRSPGVRSVCTFNQLGEKDCSEAQASSAYNSGSGVAGGDNNSYSFQERGNNDFDQDFYFEFAVPCIQPKDNNDQPLNFFLKWFDADWGGIETDTISWELHEVDRDGNSVRLITSQADSQLGGNAVYGEAEIPGQPDGTKMVWIWRNVNRTNGVRLWVPFDSVSYNNSFREDLHNWYANSNGIDYDPDNSCAGIDPQGNDLKVQGMKVIGENSNITTPPNGSEVQTASIDMQGMTSSPNPTTAQPYEFNDISYDEEQVFTPQVPSGYRLLGYTLCENPDGTPKLYGLSGPGIPSPEQPCDHSTLDVTPMPGGTMTLPTIAEPQTASTTFYVDLWFHYASNDNYITFHKVNADDCTTLASSDPPSSATIRRTSPSRPTENSSAITGTFIAGSTNNVSILNTTYAGWTYEGARAQTTSACSTNGIANVNNRNVSFNANDNNVTKHVFFYFSKDDELGFPEHKIYGANLISMPNALRDNQTFRADVDAYIWPDATTRTNQSGVSKYLWVSGIYGNDSGDTLNLDSSPKANVNSITSLNLEAELNCPGSSCKKRVPLAYVPQSDNLGIPNTNGTKGKDRSTTPNGNHWLTIKQEQTNDSRIAVSVDSNQVISCGTYGKQAYNPNCGGIFSNNSTADIGGHTGNNIENVEISNIRVRAVGVDSDAKNTLLQGKVDSAALQLWDRNRYTEAGELPSGSQGPDPILPRWDNVRNPNTDDTGFNQTTIPNRIEFPNSSGSPSNFSFDPQNVSESQADGRKQQIRDVTLLSLLQDGQDTDSNPPYTNPSEPVTYTSTVDSLDRAELVWDEYIDWTQVDDKGHWSTTRAQNIVTGIDRGPSTRETLYWDSYTVGTPVPNHTHYNTCDESGSTDPDDEDYNPDYQTCYSYNNHDHVRETCDNTSYDTAPTYIKNTKTYTPRNLETRYGWLNTSKTLSSLNGTNTNSYFGGDPTTNPTWANTGNTAYWQDTSITPMDNSGSTNKPPHTQRWEYNTTDKAYSKRYIYSGSTTPNFNSSYTTNSSEVCIYDNGSINNDNNSRSYTWYPSASNLYESSATPSGHVYGVYGSGAAGNGGLTGNGDGRVDNTVDTGWQWVSNPQRVRYETSYTDHYRRLGERLSALEGGIPGAVTDNLLYGLQPNSNLPTAASILPARGRSTIFNATIGTANADVFSAGRLDSYFNSSTFGSAFIFTSSNGITNINGPTGTNCAASTTFCNYIINPDEDAAGNYLNGNIEAVFTNYDQLVDNSVGTISGTGSTNIRDKIYHHTGDLTLTDKTVTGGAGLIIVEGDLRIRSTNGTGNGLVYGPSGSNRETLPSLGIIVRGRVIIEDSVRRVDANIFTAGCFIIDSRIADANAGCTNFFGSTDTTTNDMPFRLNGLVVARRFALLRQPSGARLSANSNAEFFNYDGRVVVNTPPGFSRIFSEAADWNEATPRN
ncbi:TPA: hypothetical protein EYO12_04435 [Candidatus Saccharibacteria bacterium]|nr:hypothetical protein [Candidatus Saccharibacteria bacterium]HIO87717.1 hypothetical protein [Candidatus Saccharibacteria bacterium]